MKTIYIFARPVSRLEWEYLLCECDRCEDDEEDQGSEEKNIQAVTPAEDLPCPVGLFFVDPMLNFLDEFWYMFQKHESLLRTLSTIFTT
jgi:hypothetical protein